MAVLVVGPFPKHFEQGEWPRDTLLTSPWQITWTPDTASDDESIRRWRPIAVTTSSAGGIWLNANEFGIYDAETDELLMEGVVPLLYSAHQPITFTFDFVRGEVTISGATEGDGTYTFDAERPVLTDSYLRVGFLGPNPEDSVLEGTLSDITTVGEEEEPEPIDVEAPLVESHSLVPSHVVLAHRVITAPLVEAQSTIHDPTLIHHRVLEAPLVEAQSVIHDPTLIHNKVLEAPSTHALSTIFAHEVAFVGDIIVGPFPKHFDRGEWPRDTLLTSPWMITWTPLYASDDPEAPTGWRALFITVENAGGAWINGNEFGIYDSSTDELLMDSTVALTWGAGQPITFAFDFVNGTVKISGASSGNGTYTFDTEGSVLADSFLRVGFHGPDIDYLALEGTLSNISSYEPPSAVLEPTLVEAQSTIYALTLHKVINVPLVASQSTIYAPELIKEAKKLVAPMVESRSEVYAPALIHDRVLQAPLISSRSSVPSHLVVKESSGEAQRLDAPLVLSNSEVQEHVLAIWTAILRGPFPKHFEQGEWPRDTLLTSPWQITWTPAVASDSYSDWHALLVTAPVGGFWFENNTFGIYDSSTDDLISDTATLTWSAEQPITFVFDIANGTFTISGATTGNGTYSLNNAANILADSYLNVGFYAVADPISLPIGGTLSDVYGWKIPRKTILEAPLVQSRSRVYAHYAGDLPIFLDAPMVQSRSRVYAPQLEGGVPPPVGRLGTNLEHFVDWSQTNWVTLNLFKGARDPISAGSNGEWDTGQPLDLDENWYPKSLQPGQWVRYLILVGGNTSHRPGDYVLSWEGKGTFTITEVTIVDNSTPGRWIINIPAELPYEGIWFTITSLPDPEDYIRNISIKPVEYEHLGQSFHPDYVEYLKKHKYECLRFMDWMKTNGNPTETWADRITPDHSTWTLDPGMPIEALIELANQTGINPWFCIPHMADDDYIQRFAEMVRDNLDPSLVAYFEYSNECWNWNFDQTHYCLARAEAEPERYNGSWADFYFIRMAEMFDIVSSVFGEETHRYKRVAAWQAAWWGLIHWNVFNGGARPNGPEDCMLKVDCFAIAPYFAGYFGEPGMLAETAGYTLEEFLDLVETDALQEASDWTLEYVQGLAFHGHGHIEVVAYEGGNHMSTGGANGTPEAQAVNALFDAAQDHPRMYGIYMKYLRDWQRNTNNGLFNHYYDIGEKSVYGRWGARDRFDDPIDETKPKALALFRYGTGLESWPGVEGEASAAVTIEATVEAVGRAVASASAAVESSASVTATGEGLTQGVLVVSGALVEATGRATASATAAVEAAAAVASAGRATASASASVASGATVTAQVAPLTSAVASVASGASVAAVGRALASSGAAIEAPAQVAGVGRSVAAAGASVELRVHVSALAQGAAAGACTIDAGAAVNVRGKAIASCSAHVESSASVVAAGRILASSSAGLEVHCVMAAAGRASARAAASVTSSASVRSRMRAVASARCATDLSAAFVANGFGFKPDPTLRPINV